MENKKTKNESATPGGERKLAVLSYLWILFLIPLLTKKNSEFVQFHAKQGLVLFVLSFFSIIPFFGQILTIALLIIYIIAILKTLDGEMWEIPFVYDWSKKIKL